MGADYKLNDHSTLAAHFLLSDFKDWGDKWTYTVQTDAKPKFKYSIRRPDFIIGSLSIGGNHILRQQVVHLGFLCLARRANSTPAAIREAPSTPARS